ncbi:GNAT family N-acetyltransferase [Endozoicomonadaceae bacterium StTr2]
MSEITVRALEDEDVPAMKALLEGPSAFAGTLQLPMPSRKMWKERLQAPRAGVYHYVAEIDGQLVGHIVFDNFQNPRRRHVASFGLAVKDEYQNRGVGSALMEAVTDLADNWLNLRRIELTVFTDNESGIRLYKKFGFKVEGESPDYAFRNGKYVGVYHMGRIRPEDA